MLNTPGGKRRRKRSGRAPDLSPWRASDPVQGNGEPVNNPREEKQYAAHITTNSRRLPASYGSSTADAWLGRVPAADMVDADRDYDPAVERREGELPVTTNVVNLDALIRREDLAAPGEDAGDIDSLPIMGLEARGALYSFIAQT
jgi:hypothetical protein